MHSELVSAYQQELNMWIDDLEFSCYGIHTRAIRRFEPEATRKQKLRKAKQEYDQKIRSVLGIDRVGDLPKLSKFGDIDVTQYPAYPELTVLLLLRIEREPPA